MVIKCKRTDFEEGKTLKREIKKREKLEAKKDVPSGFCSFFLSFIDNLRSREQGTVSQCCLRNGIKNSKRISCALPCRVFHKLQEVYRPAMIVYISVPERLITPSIVLIYVTAYFLPHSTKCLILLMKHLTHQ